MTSDKELSSLAFTLFDTSNKPLCFLYTNWRGESSWRQVWPGHTWYGTTEWHKDPQWFLHALDIDKNEVRDFALVDIREFANRVN